MKCAVLIYQNFDDYCDNDAAAFEISDIEWKDAQTILGILLPLGYVAVIQVPAPRSPGNR